MYPAVGGVLRGFGGGFLTFVRTIFLDKKINGAYICRTIYN